MINSNLRQNVPGNAQWITSVTHPYSVIQSPCEKVRIAFLGLLSDEPGVFRDNTFRGIPIANVLDTYSELHRQIVPNIADFCIPLTHASMQRDRELARHMMLASSHGGDRSGIIIGGHEHEPYDERIEGEDGTSTIRIFKSGVDAKAASLIDLSFEIIGDERPKLVEVEYDLVEMSDFEPSVVVQSVVDRHMSVVQALEDEFIIDADSTTMLPPGVPLSSERTRFQPTSVGSTFCQMIKEELEIDVALINGATIKGGKIYENGKMSYAELKKELPFPTKMVVVQMQRYVLEEAIHFSRNAIEDGTDVDQEEIPRRGFLQVDWDFDQTDHLGFPDDVLQVALPRNLLNGFCKIEPLMDIGSHLKDEGLFPGDDEYYPAVDVIVRHACKNRWTQIIGDMSSFQDFDLNGDGVLDRHEIKVMMERVLGHEPADFVVDDMIASIDTDENGVIDRGEFSYLLAIMEREQNKF
jgi:5'-nucleotidase